MENFIVEIKNFLKSEFNLIPKEVNVFLMAFTHSSFTENQDENYERLEFLGDSCIGLVVTQALYNLPLPIKAISPLRQEIVQCHSLAHISSIMGLDKYLRVGKSCRRITESMKEDLYESFIGAVLLSFGYKKAEEIVLNTLWKSFMNHELNFSVDYKTKLQEFVQQKFKCSIKYKLSKTVTQPNGVKSFFVQVEWGKTVGGKGSGRRVKEAEQEAAKDALSKFS